MKELFENFKNTDQKIIASESSFNYSSSLYGHTTIKKGGLEMEVSYSLHFEEMSYTNCVSVMDWDIHDTSNTTFNGLPIDDLDALKLSLKSSGLKSIAESLVVKDLDIFKAVALEVSVDKTFKAIFGEDAILWDTLSEDEQEVFVLNRLIDMYDKLSVNTYNLKKYLVEVETEEDREDKAERIPTLKELKAILKEVKLKVKNATA